MGDSTAVAEKVCANCGNSVAELVTVTPKEGSAMEVCANCQKKLMSSDQPRKKSFSQKKEENRLALWRSRVQLIRSARDRFIAKDFAGAAVAYEKYLRVLEIIYEVPQNGLDVQLFNNEARSKELLVLASTYWDLVLIYDQSKKHSTRLDQCAEKLGAFLPYTPIRGEVIEKITEYRKNAKHPDTFTKILRLAKKGKRRCFIATAAFETDQASTVKLLTVFRDDILEQSIFGRAFVSIYYRLSPPIAHVIDRNPEVKKTIRSLLNKIASFLDKKYNLKSGSR